MSAARRIVPRRSTGEGCDAASVTACWLGICWAVGCCGGAGCTPLSESRYETARAASGPRSSAPSRDELIVASARQRQDTLLLERADDRDDLGLCLLDGAGTHRAEHLDLLGEVLGCPLGQVADHLVADVGPDTLEGGGQLVRVDLAEHLLQRPVVDRDDVLEDEHLGPHLLGQLGGGA